MRKSWRRNERRKNVNEGDYTHNTSRAIIHASSRANVHASSRATIHASSPATINASSRATIRLQLVILSSAHYWKTYSSPINSSQEQLKSFLVSNELQGTNKIFCYRQFST